MDCPRCRPFEHNWPFEAEERDVHDDEIHGVDKLDREDATT
jgi:hypothetical protein